jgi:hypothetical protein
VARRLRSHATSPSPTSRRRSRIHDCLRVRPGAAPDHPRAAFVLVRGWSFRRSTTTSLCSLATSRSRSAPRGRGPQARMVALLAVWFDQGAISASDRGELSTDRPAP